MCKTFKLYLKNLFYEYFDTIKNQNWMHIRKIGIKLGIFVGYISPPDARPRNNVPKTDRDGRCRLKIFGVLSHTFFESYLLDFYIFCFFFIFVFGIRMKHKFEGRWILETWPHHPYKELRETRHLYRRCQT